MIDGIDIFEIYQQDKSDRRIVDTGNKLRDLEQRYERMALVTNALWQLLKSRTGLTDADLKMYIEKVDLADGARDGKASRSKAAMDCPQCTRRVLKSATVCSWCGTKLASGDPFQSL